jgi:hypothetical protein
MAWLDWKYLTSCTLGKHSGIKNGDPARIGTPEFRLNAKIVAN